MGWPSNLYTRQYCNSLWWEFRRIVRHLRGKLWKEIKRTQHASLISNDSLTILVKSEDVELISYVSGTLVSEFFMIFALIITKNAGQISTKLSSVTLIADPKVVCSAHTLENICVMSTIMAHRPCGPRSKANRPTFIRVACNSACTKFSSLCFYDTHGMSRGEHTLYSKCIQSSYEIS